MALKREECRRSADEREDATLRLGQVNITRDSLRRPDWGGPQLVNMYLGSDWFEDEGGETAISGGSLQTLCGCESVVCALCSEVDVDLAAASCPGGYGEPQDLISHQRVVRTMVPLLSVCNGLERKRRFRNSVGRNTWDGSFRFCTSIITCEIEGVTSG